MRKLSPTRCWTSPSTALRPVELARSRLCAASPTSRPSEHHLDGWIAACGHGLKLLHRPLRINLVWFLHVATLLFFAKKFPRTSQPRIRKGRRHSPHVRMPERINPETGSAARQEGPDTKRRHLIVLPVREAYPSAQADTLPNSDGLFFLPAIESAGAFQACANFNSRRNHLPVVFRHPTLGRGIFLPSSASPTPL